jgi:hypothetical protein
MDISSLVREESEVKIVQVDDITYVVMPYDNQKRYLILDKLDSQRLIHDVEIDFDVPMVYIIPSRIDTGLFNGKFHFLAGKASGSLTLENGLLICRFIPYEIYSRFQKEIQPKIVPDELISLAKQYFKGSQES